MNTTSPALSRGQATRDALVQAAIDGFGRDGYDAVSIRRIAQMADANPAMISYHFGGKEGLYAAAVEHIAEQIGQRMGPVVQAIQPLLAAPESDRAACFEAICRMADGLLVMMTRPRSAAWARIILREQQDPGPGFEILFGGPMSRVLGTVVALHARVMGRDEPGDDDRLGAILLIGQVAVFRSNHAAVLRAMGWGEIGDAELAAIRTALRRNFARILGVET